MGTRTTRVLFLLALGAWGAFFLVERPRREARDRAQLENARLAEFDPSRVDGLSIRRSGETLRFALEGSHWNLISPIPDLAELSSVVSLLQGLLAARVERNLGAAADDRRFGLDAPVSIALTAGTDTIAHVDIGAFTVDRAFVYARRADGDIVLAPTELLRASTLPLDSYRNRRVVTFDLSVVRAVDLRTPAGTSRWLRSPPNHWFTIVAGDTIEGDSTAVEGVLRTVRGLRVAHFVAPGDTAGVLARADAVVTVENLPPAPAVTVRFSCPPGVPCRARSDHETRVVEVDSDIDRVLEAGLQTLRERRVLHFAPRRVARIELSLPDTSGVLVRVGDSWGLPNPALGSIDAGLARDLVRSLRALQWTRIADSSTRAPGPGDPSFSLVLHAGDGTILDGVRGTVRGMGVIAVGTAKASGLTTEIDPAALDALSAHLHRLRARTPRP